MSRRTDAVREVLVDVKRLKPVRMTLEDGRSRAFDNLQEGLRWAKGEENGGQPLPKNDAQIAVRLPTELKEFVRDCGQMSPQIRGLIMKAAGAVWKAHKKGADRAPIRLQATPPRAARAKRRMA